MVCVINQLDPIDKIYDMYSEDKEILQIMEKVSNGLDMDSDLEDRPLDLYLEL